MHNINLLVTTALYEDDENRIYEVNETINSIEPFINNFKTIKFLETICDKNVYNNDKNFYEFYTSKFKNTFKYKGTNWIKHIFELINNQYTDDNDIIIFLSGRYLMVNDNILDIIKDKFNNGITFIAKNDGDIYSGNGVHTFYIAFTKKAIIDFYNYYINLNEHDPRIEWDLKKYMNNNINCEILDKDTIMGVLTNISETKLKKIC